MEGEGHFVYSKGCTCTAKHVQTQGRRNQQKSGRAGRLTPKTHTLMNMHKMIIPLIRSLFEPWEIYYVN